MGNKKSVMEKWNSFMNELTNSPIPFNLHNILRENIENTKLTLNRVRLIHTLRDKLIKVIRTKPISLFSRTVSSLFGSMKKENITFDYHGLCPIPFVYHVGQNST